MDDSFGCITPEGLVYINPSPSPSPEIGSSSTPEGPTLDEAKLAILQSCKLAELTEDQPLMWKNLQRAYTALYNADLDKEELNRLFSTSDIPEILASHFPELMLCLADGGYQIELLPGHDLDEMIDSLTPNNPQSRPLSAWSTDANGDSGYSASEVSNFPSRPPSAMSEKPASSEVRPLRSMKPTSAPLFTTPEEVIAVYDEIRRDREANRVKFHNYISKKSAELEAMKKAEIAAIEAKYDHKMLTFSKFIDQRLQTAEALEEDDDAFFVEQLQRFTRN